MPSNAIAVIDTQQLFLAARREYGPFARIDYVKLKEKIEELAAGDVRIVAYVLMSPLHNADKFIGFLKQHGIAVFRKPASRNETGEIEEPNWTSTIVLQISSLMSQYKHLILVSGSGGFFSLIELANKTGKKTTVVSFKSTLNTKIKDMSNVVILLNDDYLFKEK